MLSLFFFLNKPTNSINFQSPALAQRAQMKSLPDGEKRHPETVSLHEGRCEGVGSTCLVLPKATHYRTNSCQCHGTENPGGENTGAFLSSRQQTDQCAAASAQLAEGGSLPARGFPLQSTPSPTQVQNTQEPGRAGALGGSQDVLTRRVTSCRADVPLGSSYSRAVVYHFAFSALAKKDAPLLHSVTQKRLNMHVVMFSNRHQQTSPVGNRALYWQFISALNTSHSE